VSFFRTAMIAPERIHIASVQARVVLAGDEPALAMLAYCHSRKLDGWRNTLTEPVSSCQRIMRLWGISPLTG
jgi:tRNA(His) 5'-end guanylyltransferase